MAFLDRLYTAKRKVEKRIAILGGEPELVRKLNSGEDGRTNYWSSGHHLALHQSPSVAYVSRCEIFSQTRLRCRISWNLWTGGNGPC